ncbi:MAG TPA: glycosyltransferase family 4 protein [Chitinophagaceae bacterium]|nr:glycosyltransferase family 4 protein [Chitinophagaceae bacterium]
MSSEQTRHIVIIASYLNHPGGYERIVPSIANLFTEKGNKVTLLIIGNTSETFYPIHNKVNIILKPYHFGIADKGNMISRKIKMLSDIRGLKKILFQLSPDIVIGTEYHISISAQLTGIKKKAKLIAWEHTPIAQSNKNRFWNFLFKKYYPRFNAIVCLTKAEKHFFSQLAPTSVIHNFTDNQSGNYASLQSKTILSIARLSPEKGIDLLLQTAKKVLSLHPSWKWKLIGTGPLKKMVKDFIINENLSTQLILQEPTSSHLNDEYLQASLFVLSSRYESMSMVLLEAQSFGVPLVSFNCPDGPAEIITHEVNGLMAPKENSDALAQAILSLIENPSQAKQLSQQAITNAIHFNSDSVYTNWESLFDKLLL